MREFIDRLTAVDVHAEGEPGRVITAGVPDLPGATMLEKMQWMEANVDDIRLRMLREPNGYPGLCCNVIVPPTDPAADAGFIIMEQTEYPPMSGSNTICVTTALLETGIVPMVEPVTELVLESPAGLIGVRADCADGITGPTISQLSGAPSVPGAHRRNAVTVATGELDWDRPETWGGALDRCPCGTGTSAKMAVLHARGELGVGDEFVHEGPLGTTFTGRILEETTVAGIPAVVPEIGGQGWITGFAEYVLDPTDPFPAGFTIGDIWP